MQNISLDLCRIQYRQHAGKKYAFELLSQSDSKKEPAHYGASSYIAQKYLMACKEIDEKEYEMEKMKQEQEIILEKNNVKVKTMGEYPM